MVYNYKLYTSLLEDAEDGSSAPFLSCFYEETYKETELWKGAYGKLLTRDFE